MNITVYPALLALCVVLVGCAGGGSRACEVMSPAQIASPTTENNQRVEAQTTGEPQGSGAVEQNCP